MNLNINKLVEESVNIIKSKCELPDNGFLAGGSLANITYGLLHNVETTYDDVDVFVLKELVKDRSDLNYNNFFIQAGIKKKLVDADGGYPSYITELGDYFFSIESSKEEGILNTIQYYANTEKPFFIDGFDLNCTQVSYNLKNGEIYYTKEFEHFLTNQEIEINNLKTANNTVIRYLKKCRDLKIKPIKDNVDMVYCYLKHSDNYFFEEKHKLFKEKMYNKYKLNKNVLEKYFIVKEEKKNQKGEILYRLILNTSAPIDEEKHDKIFNKKSRFNYQTLDCWRFPKFWKKALTDSYKEIIYEKLSEFADGESYIDIDNASVVDIDILSSLSKSSSTIAYNLLI